MPSKDVKTLTARQHKLLNSLSLGRFYVPPRDTQHSDIVALARMGYMEAKDGQIARIVKMSDIPKPL